MKKKVKRDGIRETCVGGGGTGEAGWRDGAGEMRQGRRGGVDGGVGEAGREDETGETGLFCGAERWSYEDG